MEKNRSDKNGGALRELLPGYLVIFSLCYMLFIYEPLIMYGTNVNDFWFDLGIMIRPVMGIFAIFFFGAAAVLTGVYFLSRLFSEKAMPYKVVICALTCLFVPLYFQGNYLVSKLPALDGSEISWDGHTAENIIFIGIIAVMAAVCVAMCVKLGADTFVKAAAAVSAAIVVMLTVSLVSTAAKNDIFQSKNALICSGANFNSASSDKNFYIFLVDSQNCAMFNEVLDSDEELKKDLADFTYFPDTTSAFAYTRDSVPFILTGIINKNEKSFRAYATDAYNGSGLFGMLDERGYEINLYGGDFPWYGERKYKIANNPTADNPALRFDEFFAQEMRYVWFKYLPYALKKYSDIEHLDFGRSIERYRWNNDSVYNEIKDNPKLSLSPRAQFSYIHTEGVHVPFDMDEDLNRIDGGTFLQKTKATAKLIRAFLQRLRDNGVYDDSVIIIMADHGYTYTEDNLTYILKRFNPILLIKGAGESHEFAVSDKPVSHFDLNDAYRGLLDGKRSDELFADISYPRTRTVMWYEIYSEEHMVEYETDSTATDWESFRPTGNVYDLK